MSTVTRKSRSSRARRREEMQDRLLLAVESLLGRGERLAQLSINEICAAAAVPRSTFYVHFADRGELLGAWLADIAGSLETVGAEWWALGSGSGRADVRSALSALVMAYRPHARLMGELYAAAGYDPALRARVDTVTARNVIALRRHIAEGQREGWVSPELPAAETAGWLMCMAARGQHRLVAEASDREVAELITGLADIIWYTLYAYAPARGLSPGCR